MLYQQRDIFARELSNCSAYVPMKYVKMQFDTNHMNIGVSTIHYDNMISRFGCEKAGPENLSTSEFSAIGN